MKFLFSRAFIKILPLSIVLLCSVSGYTQSLKEGENIVPNGDFERVLKTTEGHAYLDNLVGWFNPSGDNQEVFNGTPDHLFVPKQNTYPWIMPRSGQSVIGLITYLRRRNNYREYASIALKRPLEVGKTYELRFHVSTGYKKQFGSYANASVGALLTTEKPMQHHFYPLVLTAQQFSFDSLFYDTEWLPLQFTFTANAPATFLTLGNFKLDRALNLVQKRADPDPQAYIFIDDVSLVEKTPTTVPPKPTSETRTAATMQIKERPLNIQERIAIRSQKCILKIWDDKSFDRDKVSIFLNEKALLYRYVLRKRKKKIVFYLPEKQQSYFLVMYAENLGSSPPNTAKLTLKSGSIKRTIRISSDLETSGTIQLKLAK